MSKLSIEALQSSWASDCIFDRTDLAMEQANTPFLHSKYLNWLFDLKLEASLLKTQYDEKYLAAYETLTQGTSYDWADKDWIPVKGRISKKDEIEMYINANKELVNMKLKMALVNEQINFVTECIKHINQRNFQIKNIIDWERFKNGG